MFEHIMSEKKMVEKSRFFAFSGSVLEVDYLALRSEIADSWSVIYVDIKVRNVNASRVTVVVLGSELCVLWLRLAY